MAKNSLNLLNSFSWFLNNCMQPIIDPIDKSLIKSELTVQKRVRVTNKANNEIYVFTAHDSPNLMKEVGRLREIAFRHYGGGTGLEADIDKYDTM